MSKPLDAVANDTAPTVFVRGSLPPAPFEKKRDAVADALVELAEAEDSRRNLEMAQKIIQALSLHYPKHRWEAYVDLAHGNINVRNLSLSGKWGMQVSPKNDDIPKTCVKLAGELLERYNIARTRAGAEQAAEFMKKQGAEYRAQTLAKARRLVRGQGIDWSKVKPEIALALGPAAKEPTSA